MNSGLLYTIDQLGQTLMQRDQQIVALQGEIDRLRAQIASQESPEEGVGNASTGGS